MTTQYDLVADKYDMMFQASPYRQHVEAYSAMQAIGDVKGLDVLDFATGTGYYARLLHRLGAKRIVGVDIAEPMVQVARDAEKDEPLGITYHVADVTQFRADTPFDMVLAIYLLHYAPTKEILLAMCQSIAANLKPGGRFVTYQFNPDIAPDPHYYDSHGLLIKTTPTYTDGEVIVFQAQLGGFLSPEITAYRWEVGTVNEALQAAGFTNIRWIDPTLSPGAAELAETFTDYLAKPHAVLLECVKSA